MMTMMMMIAMMVMMIVMMIVRNIMIDHGGDRKIMNYIIYI